MNQSIVTKPNNQESYLAEDEIDLLELWLTIWKHRILISLITVSAILISTLIVSTIPPQFEATTTFLPIPSVIPNPIAIDNMVLLKSLSLAEKVVTKGNLRPLLLKDESALDTKEMEGISPLVKATLILQKRVDVSKEKKNGKLISVKVSWKDRLAAADMANWYVEELEKYLVDSNLSLVETQHKLIRKQLTDTEQEMKVAEEVLRTFSKKYQIFDLSGLTSSLFSVIGVVKGQIALEEANLRSLSQFQNRDSQKLLLPKAKLKALYSQLRGLEQGIDMTSSKVGKNSITGTTIDDLPKLRMEYSRLRHELAIQQEFYRNLRTRLKAIKAREVEIRETKPLLIIDRATPPQFPSKPKKGLIIVVSAVTSLILAVFLVFLIEFIQTTREKHKV